MLFNRRDTPAPPANADSLVTIRELHQLDVKTERRFGRVEKLMVALFAAYLAPKLGAPDLSRAAQTAVLQLVQLL